MGPLSLKYFKLEEFACHCGCKTNKMDLAFIEKCESLRVVYGRPLVISSGYRCPKHNAAVSSTGLTGPHTTGHAADFLADRGDAYDLMQVAVLSGKFSGFGFQQKGAGRFIHLDDLPNAAGQPRPTIWTY